MAKEVDILILGAGPTGLGAAHRLIELGREDFLVAERADSAGGLSRSHLDEHGFTWDTGVHVNFSKFEYFKRAMLKALPLSQWKVLKRRSYVWMRYALVPYPFQNNIRYLRGAEREQSLLDLQSAEGVGGHYNNFAEWIEGMFGKTISDLFLRPYNQKIWSIELEKMDFNWIADRVAVPSAQEVSRSLENQSDETDWGPNAEFLYPSLGGAGRVWREMAAHLSDQVLHLNSPISAISGNKALGPGGREIRFQRCLSTLPITELVKMVEGVPRDILECAEELAFTTVSILGIGLKGRPAAHLREASWIYFPQPEVPFYRVTIFSNLSASNVPDEGHWSLLAEVSHAPGMVPAKEDLFLRCLQSLRDVGLISFADEVVSQWYRLEKYGYPVPTLGRDKALQRIQDFLTRRGIYSLGRFGAWRYEEGNQDHSFMQGVNWVDTQLGGSPKE